MYLNTNMSHSHLTRDDRVELVALLKVEKEQKDIAELLGKDPSTISRELARNTDPDGIYRAGAAQQKVRERRTRAKQASRKLEHDRKTRRHVVRKLKLYWSPEQIAGRLKLISGRTIASHETIYRFVYEKRPDLKKYLRCRKGKYRRRYGTRKREKAREEAKKRRINERPEIVEKRSRIGDWEGDTIIGGEKKQRILTHVERKSGYLLADKLDRVSAELVRKVTIQRFRKLPRRKRWTTTYDNGSELADYELIERGTKMTVYHAYPYHSWERGTNENTNGLLRQFFPKKMSFDTITQNNVSRAVFLLNHRPRKRLGWRTPHEVFMEKENCVSS